MTTLNMKFLDSNHQGKINVSDDGEWIILHKGRQISLNPNLHLTIKSVLRESIPQRFDKVVFWPEGMQL